MTSVHLILLSILIILSVINMGFLISIIINSARGCHVIRHKTDYTISKKSVYPFVANNTTWRHFVESWHIHEKFDLDSGDNNIGLLKVKKRFKRPYEQPIMVASWMFRYEHNQELIVVGWDYKDNFKIQWQPYKVKVEIVDYSQCKKQYQSLGINLTENMFCAQDTKRKEDACAFDSGEAIFTSNHVLIGIISRKESCVSKGIPGVYTKISHYQDWINSVIGVVNEVQYKP